MPDNALNQLSNKVAKKNKIYVSAPRGEKGRFQSLLTPKAKDKLQTYKNFWDPQQIVNFLRKHDRELQLLIDKYTTRELTDKQKQKNETLTRQVTLYNQKKSLILALEQIPLLEHTAVTNDKELAIIKENLKYTKITTETLFKMLNYIKMQNEGVDQFGRVGGHPIKGTFFNEQHGGKGEGGDGHGGSVIDDLLGTVIAGYLGVKGIKGLKNLSLSLMKPGASAISKFTHHGEIMPPEKGLIPRAKPTAALDAPFIEGEIVKPGSVPEVKGGAPKFISPWETPPKIQGPKGFQSPWETPKALKGPDIKSLTGPAAKFLPGILGRLAGPLGLALTLLDVYKDLNKRRKEGGGIVLQGDPDKLKNIPKLLDKKDLSKEDLEELKKAGVTEEQFRKAQEARKQAGYAGKPIPTMTVTAPRFNAEPRNRLMGNIGTPYNGPSTLSRATSGHPIGSPSGTATRLENGRPTSGVGEPADPNVRFDGKEFNEKAPGIMQKLKEDFDLDDDSAAAVLGNLGHESGGFRYHQEVNPVGGGRGGAGWAQWTGSRRDQFEAWSKANNLDPTSDAANYGFLKHELQTSESSAIRAVKGAQGLENKTAAFEGAFERAGIKAYGSRNKFARTALDAYKKNPTQGQAKLEKMDQDNQNGKKLEETNTEISKIRDQRQGNQTPTIIAPQSNPVHISGSEGSPNKMMANVRNEDPTFMRALLLDYKTA